MANKFTSITSGGSNIPVYDKDAHTELGNKLDTSAFSTVSGGFASSTDMTKAFARIESNSANISALDTWKTNVTPIVAGVFDDVAINNNTLTFTKVDGTTTAVTVTGGGGGGSDYTSPRGTVIVDNTNHTLEGTNSAFRTVASEVTDANRSIFEIRDTDLHPLCNVTYPQSAKFIIPTYGGWLTASLDFVDQDNNIIYTVPTGTISPTAIDFTGNSVSYRASAPNIYPQMQVNVKSFGQYDEVYELAEKTYVDTNIDGIKNTLSSNSGRWDDTRSTLYANSGRWDASSPVTGLVDQALSATIGTNSAMMGDFRVAYTPVTAQAGTQVVSAIFTPHPSTTAKQTFQIGQASQENIDLDFHCTFLDGGYNPDKVRIQFYKGGAAITPEVAPSQYSQNSGTFDYSLTVPTNDWYEFRLWRPDGGWANIGNISGGLSGKIGDMATFSGAVIRPYNETVLWEGSSVTGIDLSGNALNYDKLLVTYGYGNEGNRTVNVDTSMTGAQWGCSTTTLGSNDITIRSMKFSVAADGTRLSCGSYGRTTINSDGSISHTTGSGVCPAIMKVVGINRKV